jgi:hypothetical protein
MFRKVRVNIQDTSGFIQNLITPTDGMPYQKKTVKTLFSGT